MAVALARIEVEALKHVSSNLVVIVYSFLSCTCSKKQMPVLLEIILNKAVRTGIFFHFDL